MSAQKRFVKKGFTLVEILIVVVILGILAAIVIPQFTSASETAKGSSLQSQLQTIRSQLELYQVQHNGDYPTLAQMWDNLTLTSEVDGTTPGDASGNEFGPYLQQTPVNPLNQNTRVEAIDAVDPAFTSATPPAAPGTDTGFVVSKRNAKVWATNADEAFYYDESRGILVYP